MSSLNKVMLIGRLGRDPETRYTSGGQGVCNFTLATDESYKDRAGERQKKTTWHNIVVWGKQAEIAQQYLKKGSLVYLEGKIQTRQWDDKEGQKRTTFEIVSSTFTMLDSKGSSGNAPATRPAQTGSRPAAVRPAQAQARTAARPAPAAPEESGYEGNDEDVPF